MTKQIEIPLSKNKLYLIVFGSLLFVIAGIWLITSPNQFQNISINFLDNLNLIKSIGILSILFFGITGIYGIRKISDNRAGLIIDKKGITDNSNASSIGLIEWNDITEIKTEVVGMSTRFIMINVNDPEKYIKKATSNLKSKLMRANMKMYGTPLSITANTLNYDFDKLEQLVESEYSKNKYD
ncbi:STM3941 family protein [uncultured Tenacibaculum sp.]|uniref:STM3941 family protein n=1 Tax=uncultured Tenacibaculum sp. TaxID=174713 RepID=UPI00261A56D8|nr:STM3941 family protein [uncultured Tenacibaculum sp.]